jgi:hypothetical protein
MLRATPGAAVNGNQIWASPVSFHQRQKVAFMATASAIVLTREKRLDTLSRLTMR